MESKITRRTVLAGAPAVAAVAALPAIPALAAMEQDPHPKWWAERQACLAESERLYEKSELVGRRLPAWVHERARVRFGNRRGVNNELEPMWAYDEDTLEHFREIELAVAALFPKPEKILAKKNAYYDGLLADLHEQWACRRAEREKAGVARLDKLGDEAMNRAVELDSRITDTIPRTLEGLVIQLRLIAALADDDNSDAKLAANALGAAERLGGVL